MPDMTIPGTPDQQPYRVPVTPPQPAPIPTPPIAPWFGRPIDPRTGAPTYSGNEPFSNQTLQPLYPPPASPKKKGLPGWGIALIVIGAVVLVICGGGAILFAIGVGSAASAPKPTVRITSCEYDGVIATYANYTIKNNDTKPHDYYVEGTIGHSPALPDVLKNVAPGETASGKLMGTDQGDCHITSVDQQ